MHKTALHGEKLILLLVKRDPKELNDFFLRTQDHSAAFVMNKPFDEEVATLGILEVFFFPGQIGECSVVRKVEFE